MPPPSPEAPPEGELLNAQRIALHLSMKKAAQRAGISGGRWGQICKGWQSVGGQKIRVRGPAETIARMAVAVRLPADQLRRVAADSADDKDRRRLSDAADIVQRWAREPSNGNLLQAIDDNPVLTPENKRVMRLVYAALVEAQGDDPAGDE